ncbi:MAG: adenylate/guanylate cyclase domain-containing protein [Alphaproteobacteria bacterium]|nr:adenylate/guanylate cyclase domain-containing protein [Alphaproteobacteria bacterium]
MVSQHAPAAPAASTPRRIEPSIIARQFRLISGLTLLAYVVSHFLNHSLGLISLNAMEWGRAWFIGFWRTWPASTALYAAIVIHIALALWSLYRRRRLLGMPGWEAAQLILGLSIPPLLAEHVLGTRFAHQFFGVNDSYLYVVWATWVFAWEKGATQIVALLVAWLHGAIGVHFWLRVKPWYPRAVPYLYAAALILPLLALIGYLGVGLHVAERARDPEWLRAALASMKLPGAAMAHDAQRVKDWVFGALGSLLVITLVLRLVRAQWERRHGVVRLTYPDGRIVEVPPGTSVLEASRLAGIPHASVCGGRGRCSTCRVRLGPGAEHVLPVGAEEARVLARVAAPPQVRLACQLKPARDLHVVPLLPANATARDGFRKPDYVNGQEREIAILFADLRAFTQMSENRLPYDVVFLLNRYFTEMGHAVERSGGRIDKFIGDGVMALFGVDTGPERGCRDALTGARAMAENLTALNAALKRDLDRPLRIGIGIHMGHAIVGEMGYARATSVTAIGDAVNTASRLETMTKEFSAQLVVSQEVADRAGIDLARFPAREVEIRGRRQVLQVRVVANAGDLPV